MKDFQYITNPHPAYIESLYQDFIKNPSSIDVEMRKFFEGFDFAVSMTSSGAKIATTGNTDSQSNFQFDKELSVYQLIQAYRRKGHLVATTNPIRERKDRKANLTLENFGLSEADLSSSFEAGKFVGLGKASLQTIITHLQKCYTNNLGVEFRADTSTKKMEWMIHAVEHTMLQPIALHQRRRYYKNWMKE